MLGIRPLGVRLLAATIGALLVVLLLGPLAGDGSALAVAESRATVTRTITIPAGAFVPTEDGRDYLNMGSFLALQSGGSGLFVAALSFESPQVTIRKITLFALDNGAGSVVLSLERSVPVAGGRQVSGFVGSMGAENGVRSFTQSDLDYRRVTGAYGPYLLLALPGSHSAGYVFYGAKVTYSYEAGV